MSEGEAAYLLVLGDAEGIAYVLTEHRMAFTSDTPRGGMLTSGDRLLLYVTRGAYNRPNQDRGRIAGCGTVTSPVTQLDRPFSLGGRTYVSACDLELTALARRGDGAELRPLVEQLSVFPDSRTWSARLRRPLLALPPHDVAIIDAALGPHLVTNLDEAIESYL